MKDSDSSDSEDEERPLAALLPPSHPVPTVADSPCNDPSVDFAFDSDEETSLSNIGGLLTKAITTVEKTAVVSFNYCFNKRNYLFRRDKYVV